MREKRLYSTTVTPKDLYIVRQADRQIERIIQSMGRPGYVLVARQMGKTNLLLNAIRGLQRPEDAFVYVDLSNGYSTLRECFRSIIDTAISMHEEKFSECANRIAIERKKNHSLSPHREHETELKALIQSIQGKLVIFLDEIDALTRTGYSDELFAKIRSLYMVKEVMPIFKRLTYVLSGVAEPTDLIKNKALSPFNIGEKIYLESFNREEYAIFLANSKLELSQDLGDYIYQRTNGNPRMLWDICSEIEDRIMHGDIMSRAIIDTVIDELYLTTFDRPPIDHIRNTLVSDRTLRNAVTVVRWKKGESLSDDIKRRLYLFGITGPYDKGRPIEIANSIIDASIPQSWIETIDSEQSDVLELLKDEFLQGNYAEAIRLSHSAMESEDELDGLIKGTLVNIITVANLRLAKYDAAIKNIDDHLSEVAGINALESEQQYFKAIALWYKGMRQDSVNHFLSAGNVGRGGGLSIAVVELLSMCLPFENGYISREVFLRDYFPILTKGASTVENSLNRLNSYLKIAEDMSDLNLLRIKLSHLLCIGYSLIGDRSQGDIYRNKALSLANKQEQNFLRWQSAVLEVDDNSRKEQLVNLTIELAEMGFHIAERTPAEPFLFDMEALASLIANGLKSGIEDEIEQLILSVDLPTRWQTHVHMLIEVSSHVRSLGQIETANFLLAYIGGRMTELSEQKLNNQELFDIYRQLALAFENVSDRLLSETMDKYFDAFEIVAGPDIISASDIAIFYRFAMHLINSGRSSRVHSLLAKIGRFRDRVDPSLRSYFIFIDFADMIACQIDSDPRRQFEYARRILTGLPVIPVSDKLFTVTPYEIMEMRERAASVISKLNERKLPAIHRYPRNQILTVRYSDSRGEVRDKFKRLERDLNSGVCVIVAER
jgi:hypothetical protein